MKPTYSRNVIHSSMHKHSRGEGKVNSSPNQPSVSQRVLRSDVHASHNHTDSTDKKKDKKKKQQPTPE
jgi:hypothetical protein